MKVLIIGAGGQSQAVVEAINFLNDIELVGYLDRNRKLHGTMIDGIPVLGDMTILPELIRVGIEGAIIAIGDNIVRRKYAQIIKNLGLNVVSAIHPKSIISPKAYIGEGVYIGPGAVIGPHVEVGNYTVININATVPHYNVIGDYVNISPNVAIGGGTSVGEGTFIGIGVSAIQYVKIGRNCMIGAGAVIVKDIPDNVTAYGVPARAIKNNATLESVADKKV